MRRDGRAGDPVRGMDVQGDRVRGWTCRGSSEGDGRAGAE